MVEQTAGRIKVRKLICEYRTNPLGIDVRCPRLGWQLSASRRGLRQVAYRVQAAESEAALLNGASLPWDTGRVQSERSIHVEYEGPELRSGQRMWWRVRVWDQSGEVSGWSEAGWWEMGLLDRSQWQAGWIGAALVGGVRTTIPAPFLRKSFSLDQPPVSARLYVTALGVYECYLNGRRVGEDVFAPGWTDYHKRVQYQVYDVGALLKSGKNAFGAILGDGWYCGHILSRGRQLYGDRPKLLAQLHIVLPDGETVIVASDGSWKTNFGPILEADMLMGESYDARLEFPGWNDPGFDDDIWRAAEVFPDPGMALVATNGPTVRPQEILEPISDPVLTSGWPQNHWIYDFGQNLVGWIELKIRGEAGTTITLRHGEMLDVAGKLYTENLRSARQTDHYTLRGGEEEIWEPHFTFHGFRYVEVQGYDGAPPRDLLSAVVLHSDLPSAGEFECSDALVNQLQHNIVWSQKGNFLDVPTDCPQRDERLGWTGDAQVFARTAMFNRDVAGFFSKWLQDLADAQLPDGAIPTVAPTPSMLAFDGGPAWADAFLIVPWTIYRIYGDTRLLARHYDDFVRFIDYLIASSPGLIRADVDRIDRPNDEHWLAGGFGDWLAKDGGGDRMGATPKALIGTAFFAHSARLMAQIAQVLGRDEHAARYRSLHDDVRAVFVRRFVTADGLVSAQTQTAYVLALHFDLLPESLRPFAAHALVRDIEKRGMHLSTGFVGTPYLLHALTASGYADVAYKLLMQQTPPSWLFPVTQGATTIWEHWDSWSSEAGFQDAAMNSFNHYAYGSVGDWLYRVVAGLDSAPDQPAFKHIVLRPRPGGGLTHARVAFESLYGRIESDWRAEEGRFIWNIVIPANTAATIHIPSDGDDVLEGEQPAAALGVEFVERGDREATFTLQPGNYTFVSRFVSTV